jgi:hypothetical protein
VKYCSVRKVVPSPAMARAESTLRLLHLTMRLKVMPLALSHSTMSRC